MGEVFPGCCWVGLVIEGENCGEWERVELLVVVGVAPGRVVMRYGSTEFDSEPVGGANSSYYK